MGKTYSKEEVMKAYECVSNNKKELMESEWCGCFACMAIFRPYEIDNWYLENEATAICPYCLNDTLIADKFGFEVSHEFLDVMNLHWRNGVRAISYRGL